MPPNNHSNESGNVFLFIMLGVVLFGALAFVIARGFRSDTTAAMSERQAELTAIDVLSFTQRLGNAVSKLQQKGISENDISFENPIVSGYEHMPAADDKAKVFNASGGGVTWQEQPSNANDGSPWFFTGHTCIANIGTGAAGCDTDTIPNEELIGILPNVHSTVCAALDKKLGIASIPDNTGGAYSNSKFTGAFADGTEIATGGQNAACYKEGTDYIFYTVLIAR